MASGSSILLVAVALAALLTIGSCGSELTFEIGARSNPTNLVLIPSTAISAVEVKEKGATGFVAFKEGPTGTWSLGCTEPLEGPFSIRFADKSGGHHVVDDAIPANYEVGSVYKTGLQV
jgi:hypothetical protein